MSEEYILIAKIRRPHGIKGEVVLESHTMDDRRFKKLKSVSLRDARKNLEAFEVESVRLANTGVLLKLKGIDDRDRAEELRNREIVIPESERAPLPKGQAYYDQIIGMDVVDDASGVKLGRVRDVVEMPAGEVFVIDLEDGSEHLVTNAGEEVKKIDVAKNELRVSLLAAY